MQFSKAKYKANLDQGYFPYFQLILKSRVSQKKAVNVVVSGEAGEGKSYMALTLAKLLDSRFTIDQVIFTYSNYMKRLRKLGMGRAIMFDEPSYAMGKRDWYKQINKVLVQTIESQRFKVHPLFIPIINKALLDKTIRDHLIQFQVSMADRGRAEVYRLQASQFEEKTYYHYLCDLEYPMLGFCPRDSCLGCRKFKGCPELRAQYERKKSIIQEKRYEQGEEDAAKIETKEFTIPQLGQIAYSLRIQFTKDDGRINLRKMRYVLRKRLKLHIGSNKGYDIKQWLESEYPEDFLNPGDL